MTEEQVDEKPVWEATVDDHTFHCKVVRTDDYAGTLIVTVTETGEVLLTEQVTLSYQAMFGPDVSDVAEWQERSLGAIDNYIHRKAQEGT